MPKIEQPEIFTDGWQYTELPRLKESEQEVDYQHMAAMGSCFARNLNRWLNFNGCTDRQMPWDILYNPFSIQKEIERLYSPVEWEANILYEVSSDGEKRLRDPWRTWHVFTSSDKLKAANEQFDQQARSFLSDSNSFLITLGISEVWSPADNPEIVLNQVPIGSIRLGEKRWTSRFTSVSEVYKSLETTVNLIRENVSPDGLIIFTLSPVPLKYTASGLSVREANNICKATLLIAVRELARNRSDVNYFPSYEMVQALSEQPNSTVWQVDGRHVNAQVVDTIANKLIEVYGKPAGERNEEKFWVPRVDEKGKIIGKLYIDGTEEVNQ